jgi:hypothetical protein
MQKCEIRVVGENLVMTLCRGTSGGKVQKTGNLDGDRRITYGWAVACVCRLAGWPLVDMFDHRFLSFELGAVKPDTAAFAQVANLLEVPAERVLFIDDNAVNVAGAAGRAFRPSAPPGSARPVSASPTPSCSAPPGKRTRRSATRRTGAGAG